MSAEQHGTPKKLTVYSVNLNTMKKTELAHFELHDGKVKATFKSPSYKSEIEEGLYDRGKMVKVKDGERFMQVLENTYVTSSAVTVERA
jgi:hypothetical protein